MTVENYYVNGESVCSGEIDLKDPGTARVTDVQYALQ